MVTFPMDIPHQDTEERNDRARGIDGLPTGRVLRLIHEEDRAVLEAVRDALPAMERLVDDAVAALQRGGRVVYAGAGTSGRLGVLDAAEIPPTFSDRRFEARMAGGPPAITHAVEGAEDDRAAGRGAAADLSDRDLAVGISASGRTPYVLGFLEAAKERGAHTWLIACTQTDSLAFLDGTVVLAAGPEVVAGSTRMKAGSATKLALTMFSTAVMIRMGKVYDGLMVDVVPGNEKLKHRAEGIIRQVTGCNADRAAQLLRRSGMRPKTAIVMEVKGLGKDEAELLLCEAEGSLRAALELEGRP
jgi:N-acetylmuramic acid 6-phosphate etherase